MKARDRISMLMLCKHCQKQLSTDMIAELKDRHVELGLRPF